MYQDTTGGPAGTAGPEPTVAPRAKLPAIVGSFVLFVLILGAVSAAYALTRTGANQPDMMTPLPGVVSPGTHAP